MAAAQIHDALGPARALGKPRGQPLQHRVDQRLVGGGEIGGGVGTGLPRVVHQLRFWKALHGRRAALVAMSWFAA